MAKYCGFIGYGVDKEDPNRPGVFITEMTRRKYYGDVTRNTRRVESGDHLNDNINVNNIISIVADDYACQNFFAIRYIEWMGSKWKVSDVEVQRPRLILTIGGVYNGK